MDSFLRQTKAGSIPVTALAAEFDSPKQTMQTEAACWNNINSEYRHLKADPNGCLQQYLVFSLLTENLIALRVVLTQLGHLGLEW